MKVFKLGWIYRITLITLIISALASCKKFIDVEPTDAVSDEQTITDKASAENAVRGTYRALSASGYYGATFQFATLMSGNALTYTQSGASGLQFLYHTITADNNDLETIWAAQYKVINQANFIIARVPAVVDPKFTESYANQLLGEGYFLRALAYFDLARTFGGVQIFLTPTQKVSDKYNTPRSTQEQTFAQVLSDLNAAEALLPSTTVRDRATKRTVWALRARLNLYEKKWQPAVDDADKIIEDSFDYKLVTPYNIFFTKTNTTESVFELSYSVAYPNPMYSNWKSGGNYIPNDSIKGLLNNPDIGGSRNTLLNTSGTKTLGGLYPQSNGTDPVYIIRIAELWLIRAEARAQSGDLPGALNDLNAVRNRAGLLNSTAVTSDEVLLAIENERRVEFAFEPHRWFDLVRNGRASSVLNVTDANRYVFPIPAPEIAADPALQQNPGY